MTSQHFVTKYKTNLPPPPTTTSEDLVVPDSKTQHLQRDTVHSVNTVRDELLNFDILRANVAEKLKLENWVVVTSYQNVYAFNLNKRLNGNLSIRKTISINADLVVKVFVNNVDGQTNDETIFELQLYRWSQLQNLVDQLKTNVKCENDLEFDGQVVAVLNDDCESNGIHQADVEPFEFCPINTTELNGVSQKALGSVIVKEEKDDSLLIGKSDILENNPIFLPHNSLKVEVDHSENASYSCSECGKKFDQNARLMIHMRRHDPNELKLCRICNLTFTGHISQHMQTHFQNKSYQCHICGSDYKHKRSFESHMKSKHFIGEFYCDICNDGKNHKTKGTIQKHMTRMHNNQIKKYEVLPANIENFQIEFVRTREEKMLVQTNKSLDGENDTSLICKTCGKEYASLRHLKLHQRRHDSSRWKVCPICNKSYPDGLSRHLNSHYKVKQHVCDMCGSAYSQASSLKEHMLINHSTAGEFFCDICKNGRKYSSRLSLKKHLLSHVRNRVEERKSYPRKDCFECKVCKEKFGSWYTLKSHTTLKHNDGSEALIYRCKFCGKEFRMRSSCSVHEKLHSGSTFTCHECGQSFKHANYLRKHLNRHKRGESQKKNCTMCEKRYVNNVDLRLHLKKVHGVDLKPGENTKV